MTRVKSWSEDDKRAKWLQLRKTGGGSQECEEGYGDEVELENYSQTSGDDGVLQYEKIARKGSEKGERECEKGKRWADDWFWGRVGKANQVKMRKKLSPSINEEYVGIFLI